MPACRASTVATWLLLVHLMLADTFTMLCPHQHARRHSGHRCLCQRSVRTRQRAELRASNADPAGKTSAPTFTEVWLDDSASTNPSLTPGENIASGSLVLEVLGAASEAECQLLVDAATARARELGTAGFSTGLDPPGRARLPVVAAAARARASKIPCAKPLPADADAVAEEVFRRILAIIDEQQPSVLAALFPGAESLAGLHASDALHFTMREPAVNVYDAGGEFVPHKDHQALTVLLALSPPSAFTAGGTGFWRHGEPGPRCVLRPRRGTALLFGGGVTHAGMPVEGGTRCVYVASFSARGGQAERAAEAAQSRDIYGDLV
jgi:hypothetical protein